MTTSSFTGSVSLEPLRGTRVCILRTGPLEYDKRTQQVAAILVSAGADVAVVCVAPAARAYETDAGYRVREVWPGAASADEVWAVRVVRNVFRLWRQYRLLVHLARSTRPHVVHCMNVDTLLVGLAVNRRCLLYDAREHFATTGHVRRYVRLWWMLKERLVVPRAAAVFTVSEPIADDLARRYSIASPTVIYNGCTSYAGTPAPGHAPLRLLHLGKYYLDRNIDEVIEIMGSLRGSATLTLQGWGEPEAALRARVTEMGLEDVVTFVPPVPPEDITESIASYDVGIINVRPDTQSLIWSAANKFFEYMGAGLVLVVPDLRVMRAIVEEHRCGVVFDSAKSGSLLTTLQLLAENPAWVEEMKRNSIKAAPAYSWEGQVGRVLEVYKRVVSDICKRKDS